MPAVVHREGLGSTMAEKTRTTQTKENRPRLGCYLGGRIQQLQGGIVQAQEGDREAMHVQGSHEAPAVQPLQLHVQLRLHQLCGGMGGHVHLQGGGASEVVDQQRDALACTQVGHADWRRAKGAAQTGELTWRAALRASRSVDESRRQARRQVELLGAPFSSGR